MEVEVGQIWKKDGDELIRVIEISDDIYIYKFEYLNKQYDSDSASIDFFKNRCTLIKAYNTPLYKVLNS